MDIQTHLNHTSTSSPLNLSVASSEALSHSGTSSGSPIPQTPSLTAVDATNSIEAHAAKTKQVFIGETHLEKNKSLIHDLIQKPTELHFYWTFGREVDNAPVRIGGNAYHERFTRYLDKLLEVAPGLLKVVLALDELTLGSNQSWINALQAKYPNRLELRFVGDAVVQLEQAFPKHTKTIQQIFANASRGNPVIASDIYRLLCMVDPAQAENTIFTYADVDTFVYGCDRPNTELEKRPQIDFQTRTFTFVEEIVEIPGHSNLLRALFQEPICDSSKLRKGFVEERDPNTSFFLYRPMERETGYKNNDIVKLKINNMSSYHAFSDDILNHLGKLLSSDTQPMSILNYFTTLHGYIKACEGKTEEAVQLIFESYLAAFSIIRVQPAEVIAVTGPGLLDLRKEECSSLGVVHPRVASWEWQGTELLSDKLSGPLDSFAEDASSTIRMQAVFDAYASRVYDGLYAKKFSENHPFYVALKAYLINNFPYDTEDFENALQERYQRVQLRNSDASFGYEEWKTQLLQRIKQKAPEDRPVGPGDSYYARLVSILATLGIEIV